MSSREVRKVSQKDELDVERFGYDVLSFILPLCGFPKEKMNYEEGKPNSYNDDTLVSEISAAVMSFSLDHRDEWKTMFESRLKASGFDTIEKIEEYLRSHLTITLGFRKGDATAKMHWSLAAYSETILFLNYKGIEFDFRQLLNSWSRLFIQQIAQNRNTREIIKRVIFLFAVVPEFVEYIIDFVQTIASPYGSRNISLLYREKSDRLKREDDARHLRLALSLSEIIYRTEEAKEMAEKLLADVQSQALLPGDREPPLNPESDAIRKKKEIRGRTRSKGVEEYRSGKLPTVSPLVKERSKVSKQSFKSPTLSPGDKESPTLSPGDKESPTLSPGDKESPASPLREEKKASRRERIRSSGVVGYKSGEVPTSLPGDRESHKSQLSSERGAVGGTNVSTRGRTRSTGVSECRSGEMRRIDTSPELQIEDRLGQMNLVSEEKRGAKSKHGDPQN